jgi:mRNA interferase MazF
VNEPRRGDLWTLAGPDPITTKPRPALVIQSDLFASTRWVTVLLMTTTDTPSPTRVPISATASTGLGHDSFVMADKPHTMPIARLGQRIGTVPASVMVDVERAILIYLDLAR